MSLQGVLFDLDLTLIDSGAAEPLRRRGQWGQVYALIPTLRPYDGIHLLLEDLTKAGLKLGVVTSAPKSYADRIVCQWAWRFQTVVGYHDTKRHKPSPEPILKGLERLDVAAGHAVYVGDHHNDVVAAHAAGAGSVATTWGSLDPASLLGARPSFVAHSVQELRQLLLG